MEPSWPTAPPSGFPWPASNITMWFETGVEDTSSEEFLVLVQLKNIESIIAELIKIIFFLFWEKKIFAEK